MDTSRLVYGGLFLQLLILQGFIYHLSGGGREILCHETRTKIAAPVPADGNIGFRNSENDVLGLRSMDEIHTHHSSSHSDMMMMNRDHPMKAAIFFSLDDLTLGKKMPIFFPSRDLPSPSSPYSLSKQEADSIPFSLKHLPHLLHRFSVSQGSPQAIAMEKTLRQCESKPIQGETKLCATSYESLFDFAAQTLGSETNNIKLLSTVHLTKPTELFQEYTIIEDSFRISAPKMVACHTMGYPYTVFYCHSQKGENRVYKVSLEGENGNRVEALAVCHMDTSHWDPNHISFQLLGTRPGSSPVCHFFPSDNFVLVSLIPSASLF